MVGFELYTLPDLPCFDLGMHVTHASFASDESDVVGAARDHGVRGILALGIDADTSESSVYGASQYAGFMVASVGVHPQAAASLDDDTVARLRHLAGLEPAVAIGLSGLDFERMRARRSEQERALERHIELAIETSLPLMLWVRSAHERAAEMIAAHRFELGAVLLHDFTGTPAELDRWLELGSHIVFTGRVCDPRRGGALAALARKVPVGRLLAATDAPFAPALDITPRVRRNEPRYLPHVVQALATARGDDPEALARTLLETSRQCLGLTRGDGSDVDARLERFRDVWG